MGRWRDIKQGKEATQKVDLPKTKTTPSLPACAPLGVRFRAFLTDTFLITTPIFYIVIYFVMGGGDSFSQNRVEGWLLIFALHAIIILFFWLKSGQTPGLKLYELKLVHTQTHEPITIAQALVRYIVTLFAIISFFLMFLPFFREDKRTFQDLFSNSSIINI